MRKYSPRTDGNQGAIVDALRAIGASVAITTAAGGGYPDLTVGYKGVNYLIEIKDPSAQKCDQKLTEHQVEWHKEWRGQKAVVKTIEEALAVVEPSINAQ